MNDTNARCEEVLTTLRRILRAISLRSKKLVQSYGLTSPQLVVLKEIKRSKELVTGQLAREVSLSQATVTSILDRLEKKGYVKRIRSAQDKRKVLVSLSEQGETVLAKTPSLLQEEFVEKFSALEAWEQSMLLSSLERLASMMGAGKLPSSPMLAIEDLDEKH